MIASNWLSRTLNPKPLNPRYVDPGEYGVESKNCCSAYNYHSLDPTCFHLVNSLHAGCGSGLSIQVSG